MTPAVELPAALGLAGVLGAALALSLLALHTALSKLGPRASKLVYAALFALVSLQLFATPLGVWTKLQGPHAKLAVAALIGALVVGALVGSLIRWGYYRGALRPLERADWLKRLGFTALLLLAALLLATYEATQSWLRGYPSARYALFGTAWLSATTAALALVSLVPATAKRQVFGLAGGALLLSMLGLLLGRASAWTTLVRVPHAEHWVSLGRWLTDFDRDGFSGFLGGGDCAPFDARVSPGAREIPGNGLDDNCRFGDAQLLPRPSSTATQPSALPAPTLNVVLITVDALRADHTTPYGYARNTTPNLAALATRAVRYSNAYTSGGWTCLAVSSLFSGVYPRRLSWRPVVQTLHNRRLLDFPWQNKLRPDESIGTILTLPSQDPPWWLPLALQRRGYRTVAVANEVVRPMFSRSFARGWDRFVTQEEIEDSKTMDMALAELAQLKTPFFLWMHLFEPHEPQTEHVGVPSFGTSMVDMYDHEVASTDKQIGRLVQALAGLPDVALIVSADHGESFDHGFQLHGLDLFEDTMHIPLLVRAPGWTPGVNTSPASLVDLAPTILALTGTPIPAGLDGRNLKDLSGNDGVITDLVRIDAQGRVWLDEMTATNKSVRLVRDNLKQSDLLVRTGDVARPPSELSSTLVPPELLEALARHTESSIPPQSSGAPGPPTRGPP